MGVLGYLLGVLSYLMGVLGYLTGVLGYPMAWRWRHASRAGGKESGADLDRGPEWGPRATLRNAAIRNQVPGGGEMQK